MRNLAELENEVLGLNLTVPAGSTKEQLMDILAAASRERDDTGRPSLLEQLPIMRARNVKDLREELFESIQSNEKKIWIAEEKLDGVRAKLHLLPNRNRIDSRHRSDITYEYVEKTGSLPHLTALEHTIPRTVLDGELIMPVEKMNLGKTKTKDVLTTTMAVVNSQPERAIELQKHFGNCLYYAFDVLFYCGQDVRNQCYADRYAALCAIVEHLRQRSYRTGYIRMPARCEEYFPAFYETLIGRGQEGIMLKNLDWPYESNKQSKGMYKWKRSYPVDAFITGFVPGKGEFSGLIGSLLVSIIGENGQAIEIAAVQPGDLPYRKLISEADGSLCDGMYGKVVKVDYLCKTKNKRLRHAVLDCFRADKNMHDCKEVGYD